MSDLPKMEDFGCTSGECPSDLELDQHQLGELGPIERAAITRAIQSCGGCRRRMEQVEAGFQGVDSAQTDAMLARVLDQFEGELPGPISRAVAQREVEPTRSATPLDRFAAWLSRPRVRWAAAAVAAALLFAVIGPQLTDPGDGDPNGPGGVRFKDGIGFTVYRVAGERAEKMLSGADFKPGDRLSFEVTAPTAGHLLVVGQESDGSVYTAYPLESGGVSAKQAAGRRALPKTVVLDSTAGRESFHAVFCPRAFSRSDLGFEGRSIKLPKDCSSTEFEMNKRP